MQYQVPDFRQQDVTLPARPMPVHVLNASAKVIFTRLDLGMVHMRQTHRRTHTLSPARFYHGLRQV